MTNHDRPWIPAAFGVLCVSLVLSANFAAWHGYFQGDDLDTLGWTRFAPFSEYLKWLASPLYAPNHFRPAGHVVYYFLWRTAGLSFPWYLLTLQMLHLLNVYLVWKLIRTVGMGQVAAGLGTLFFAFHMAVIDAYWKPQFLFDVLCATFSLGCLILFARRRFVLSFLCFWLAYKSKELAVMLPFVLAAYEFWIGERRWKPLLPFLIAALSFGLQGAVVGRKAHVGTPYALHFTWRALAHTSAFYFAKIFLTRWVGFVVLLAPVLFRDRRVYFALAAFCLFLVPLLPLSDRTGDTYLYVPLTALAVMVGVMAASPRGAQVIAVFLLFWLPWNYLHSRSSRRYELTVAAENRAYVGEARSFVLRHPDVDTLLVAGWPAALAPWGARGAFRLLYDRPVELHSSDEPALYQVMQRMPLVAEWLSPGRSLQEGAPANLSYIQLTDARSIFQLREGWGQLMNDARWFTSPATASIYRAPGDFFCTLRLVKAARSMPVLIDVLLDGRLLGVKRFRSTETQTMHWAASDVAGPAISVEFRVEDDRDEPLAQVSSFGFRPAQ